jgi:hypothetical protein
MESFTPDDTRSPKSEDNKSVAAEVLIVRIPDSEEHASLRRWMARMEVNEMVLREETNRQRKRVQTIHYTSAEVRILQDGMDLYFVGHGSVFGFLGAKLINEYALAEWIKARAVSTPLKLNKIKLVTCNGGLPAQNHEVGADLTFAARLAQTLKGIATGKVIGFSGYLLSTPDGKAIYQKEPASADRDPKDVNQKQTSLRKGIATDFAHMIMPKGVLSKDWLAWAGEVVCNDKGVALLSVLPMVGKSEAALADALAGNKCCIPWPQGKKGDLEVMIHDMSSLNDKSTSPCKLQAKTYFTLCLQEFRRMALQEWTWRKEQIALAYEAEQDVLKFERKSPHKKMSNRQECPIPPK